MMHILCVVWVPPQHVTHWRRHGRFHFGSTKEMKWYQWNSNHLYMRPSTKEEEWEEHRGRGVRWTQRTRSRINSMRVFCSSTFAQELLHVVLEGLKMLFFWKPHHLLHLGRARWGGQEWTIVTHQKLQKDACVKQQTKEKHNVYRKKKLGMRQERILIIFQNYSKSKIL